MQENKKRSADDFDGILCDSAAHRKQKAGDNTKINCGFQEISTDCRFGSSEPVCSNVFRLPRPNMISFAIALIQTQLWNDVQFTTHYSVFVSAIA